MFKSRAPLHLKSFFRAQDGAVTVDWVVLTAALVLMGIGAAFFVTSSVPLLAENIKSYMEDVEVGSSS